MSRSFYPGSFRPGHFAPVISPRSFHPGYFTPVISPGLFCPGYFTPGYFIPRSFSFAPDHFTPRSFNFPVFSLFDHFGSGISLTGSLLFELTILAKINTLMDKNDQECNKNATYLKRGGYYVEGEWGIINVQKSIHSVEYGSQRSSQSGRVIFL